MSTTSNSRADLRSTAACVSLLAARANAVLLPAACAAVVVRVAACATAVVLLGACAATRPAPDPEAPRPALAAPATKPPRVVATPTRPDVDAPIEIESATVRPPREVPEVLERLQRSAEDASRLVVIDVTTSVDIMEQRTAYPVIVLNGRPLIDTITLGPRRLAALIETDALRRDSSITITMIGDPTRASRRAVPLRAP